jgi:hypothetical protein
MLRRAAIRMLTRTREHGTRAMDGGQHNFECRKSNVERNLKVQMPSMLAASEGLLIRHSGIWISFDI